MACRVPEVDPVAEEHRRRILVDLSAGGHEAWAGTYQHSNGFEHRVLDLSPRGFFYEYSHCTGTGELAYGEIASVQGALIRLKPLFRVVADEPRAEEPTRRTDFRFEEELYSIPWGDERFLIPASLMPEFCSKAKAGGFHSMKYADYPYQVRPGVEFRRHAPDVEGLPTVPPEFQHLLPD